jgi:serine phosphatase RsbU (regulator of sigma subunit)
MKKLLFVICILIFFLCPCFGQAPENPSVQKRKADSLFTLLKTIPGNGSIKNDTLRLNVIFDLVKRLDEDTSSYYLNYAIKTCNAYSPIVENIELKNKAEVQEAVKKDALLFYYLRSKAIALRLSAGNETNDEDKIHYLLRSLRICEKTGEKQGMASSYLFICYVYFQQSVFNKAIENLLISQAIFKEIGNQNDLAHTHYILGAIYQKQNNLALALQSFTNALEISKKTGNIFQCGVYYENIGNCYIDLGNYPKAIENHLASLKMSEKLNDIKGVGDSYGDIASIYYSMKNYEKSLVNWTAALTKYKEFAKPRFIANGYRDVAEANFNLGRYNVALGNLDSALTIYQKEEDHYYTALSYGLISDVYIGKHDVANAIAYAKKEIQVCRQYQFIELLRDGYKSLSSIYVDLKDYKAAYNYHLLFIEMKDSLANTGEETIENIEVIHSKFDKERTEQEKLVQEAILAQKEAQIKQEKTQRYALYSGLGVLLLFGGFIFNRYKVSQKQQRIIQKQKHLVEEKNREITDSINYAERIQRSFLATKDQLDASLKDYFVLFKPKDVVSGDFYWAGKLHNGNFALATADSTGHGVPGAIMSILNISSLEKAIGLEISEPSEILNHTRQTIIDRLKKDGSAEGGKDGMDCSLLCFTPGNTKVIYAAANNPLWILREGSVIELPADKMPVGRHDKDTVSFTQHEVEIQKGDMIYTLTDGFPDQFGGPKGKKFMYKQLKETLITISHLPLNRQKEALTTILSQWMDTIEQVDDITLIGIRV